MSCRDVARAVEARREAPGGELPEDVRDHAAGCLACGRLVAAEDELAGALRSLRAAPVPRRPDLAATARRAAAAREREASHGWPFAAGIAGLATAAALFVAALLLGPAAGERHATPVASSTAPGVVPAAGTPLEATTVLWSNGEVDVVAPPAEPQAVAVLVEWDL